jgi:hypothetical protein
MLERLIRVDAVNGLFYRNVHLNNRMTALWVMEVMVEPKKLRFVSITKPIPKP